jgi:ABC-type multidrug transport system fused ATPase/permease subunit
MAGPLFASLTKGTEELFIWIRKRIFWYQSGSMAKNIWGMIFRLGTLAFIIIGITKGVYEIGFLILFNTYFSNIQASVTELADASQEFAIAKYGVGRMADMLATPIVIDKEEGKVSVPKDWKKIVVSNLSFSYGDKKVLDSVSFEINRGEKIGVVGLSGAGKSTLFKLLLKEHEGYEGDISIDGVPLKTISKKDYFNHIAVVLQDTEVFNLALRENIVMTNYSEKDNAALLNKALSVAHVSEFAKSLPKQLDTEIGEKGVKLSGGERQRVGLARAVFKNPELLLLDEATSHLDVESEEKIQDSLHQFFQSVTAVVIAHRLTTIKEMDKILVLEGGRIIEQGSFAELDKKKGRFHELWEKQKL